MKPAVVYLKEWNKFSLSAGYTTRHFPLFLQRTDDLLEISNQDKLKENFRRVGTIPASPAGRHVPLHFTFLNQVHGDHIVVLEGKEMSPKDTFLQIPQADGVITNVSGTVLMVLTADCLSIFFCVMKEKKASWIGLVHAGWRGTKEKIAQKAFILLMQKARCPAEDIQIAFGPSIGVKHYEVGEEFLEIFQKTSLKREDGKCFFDLAGENKHQLLEAGARAENLFDPKIDTFSANKHFYSFRREKDAAGRMISFIVYR